MTSRIIDNLIANAFDQIYILDTGSMMPIVNDIRTKHDDKTNCPNWADDFIAEIMSLTSNVTT